jgi:hypothetical protein
MQQQLGKDWKVRVASSLLQRDFIQLREEKSVHLASQYRKQVSAWIGRFRLKLEAILFGRPLDRGSRTEEQATKLLGSVVNWGLRDNTAPVHVEGHLRADRSYRRYGWIGEPQTSGKS